MTGKVKVPWLRFQLFTFATFLGLLWLLAAGLFALDKVNGPPSDEFDPSYWAVWIAFPAGMGLALFVLQPRGAGLQLVGALGTWLGLQVGAVLFLSDGMEQIEGFRYGIFLAMVYLAPVFLIASLGAIGVGWWQQRRSDAAPPQPPKYDSSSRPIEDYRGD